MATTTLTVNTSTLELARREVMQQAAADLRRGAEFMDRLAEVAPWPSPDRVEEVRDQLKLVRESLGAVEELGWPDADTTQD